MPQKVRDDTFHLFNSPGADLQYDICAYYNMKPAIIFEITVPFVELLVNKPLLNVIGVEWSF